MYFVNRIGAAFKGITRLFISAWKWHKPKLKQIAHALDKWLIELLEDIDAPAQLSVEEIEIINALRDGDYSQVMSLISEHMNKDK